MSLDKSIKSGKEHRKQYRGSKAVDSTCRNHGSCKHCRDNRLHKYSKSEETDETFYDEASALIGGEMRYFTNEESQKYEDSLNKIFKSTGINIYDIERDNTKMNDKSVDIDVLTRIVDRLNTEFDSREIYHHSSDGEMFEAQIKLDGKRVIWGIFFIGSVVVSGDEYGFFNFDEYDEYLKAVKENEEKIFQDAYRNTIGYFEKTIAYLKYSGISEEEKSKILNKM